MLFFADSGEGAVTQGMLMGSVTGAPGTGSAQLDAARGYPSTQPRPYSRGYLPRAEATWPPTGPLRAGTPAQLPCAFAARGQPLVS